MSCTLKSLSQLWVDDEKLDPACVDGPWKLQAVVSDDCMSYVAWNESSREGLIVDPKDEALEECRKIVKGLKGYLWLGVIDTHTHADHVSGAAQIASEMGISLIMHRDSGSSKVDIRIARRALLPSHAAKLEIIATPGHTDDGITVIWGPFAFTGDTVFYADVGRDDLPSGNPASHFESLNTLRQVLQPSAIILPGHDFKGGRASSWATQLKINSSLTQGREDYIAEAAAYDAPAPKAFKKSLVENLK